MSYSISVPTGPVEKFEEAVDAALDGYDWPNTNPDGEEAARKAGEAVKALADVIAVSGQHISASISGHGNPNRNNEGTGYVRDCVSISIQQQAAPAADV